MVPNPDASLELFLTNFIFNVDTNSLSSIKNDKIHLQPNEILIYFLLTVSLDSERYTKQFMFSTFFKHTVEAINEPLCSSYIHMMPRTGMGWEQQDELVSRFDILYVPSQEIILANKLDPSCFDINDVRNQIMLAVKDRVTMSKFNFNPNITLAMQNTIMNLLKDSYHELVKERNG